MHLIYIDADQRTIQATLDAGDTLGNMTGPAVIFIPADGGNREYSDIQERALAIEDAPPPPRPAPSELQTVRVADPENPADAVNLRTLDERLGAVQSTLQAEISQAQSHPAREA